MKQAMIGLMVLALFAADANARGRSSGKSSSSSSVRVDGYYRKDGTYIDSYTRSLPSSSPSSSLFTRSLPTATSSSALEAVEKSFIDFPGNFFVKSASRRLFDQKPGSMPILQYRDQGVSF